MVLQAIPLELGALACELAIMLSERDFMRAAGRDADVRSRIEVLWRASRGEAREERGCWPLPPDLGGGQRLDAVARRAAERRECRGERAAARLRLPRPRRAAAVGGAVYARNGRGAVLPELQPLSNERYIVAAELDDSGVESRIFLAAPLSEEALRRF